MSSASLLEVDQLHAGYGTLNVLTSISLRMQPGEVFTLIGRNGMGKTTIVRSLTGQIPATSGFVKFAGQEICNMPSHQIARLGISLVPEGRGIFPNLSVEENLLIGEADRFRKPTPWSLSAIYRMFPRLRERQRNMGVNLSGGEQQMLSIGRALMTNPRFLILDEATEGIAPIIRQEIWSCLGYLKRDGLAMLIIDKNLAPLARIADRHLVIEKGRIAWEGDSAALLDQQDHVKQFLTV